MGVDPAREVLAAGPDADEHEVWARAVRLDDGLGEPFDGALQLGSGKHDPLLSQGRRRRLCHVGSSPFPLYASAILLL